MFTAHRLVALLMPEVLSRVGNSSSGSTCGEAMGCATELVWFAVPKRTWVVLMHSIAKVTGSESIACLMNLCNIQYTNAVKCDPLLSSCVYVCEQVWRICPCLCVHNPPRLL